MKKGEIKEQEVYNFIKDYTEKFSIAPSYREIAKGLNIKSTNSVKNYVDRLIQKNLINKNDNKSRTIKCTDSKYSKISDVVSIPLIGRVSAGTPILAVENIEDEILISKSIFGNKEELFMLKISGDSMKNAGINNGDYVIVKQQATADNGEIVVAYLDGFSTVKRFFRYNSYIKLQPENENYEPIISKNCQVLGKVIGSIKKF